MKLTSIFALFAFAQVYDAKDITCVRNHSGVQCYDQSSLQEIMGDDTILANCTVDESNLN